MLGNGSLSNPFIIQTPQDLQDVNKNLTATANYQLGNDIDMGGFQNFIPIGNYITSSISFKGKFDGKGFAVRNLKINVATRFVGLFGVVDATGEVKNLSVENATITATAGTAGGIAIAYLIGKASKIFTSGTVEGEILYAGGVFGGLTSTTSFVEDVHSNAHVNSGKGGAGGIVGRIEHNRKNGLKNALFTGTITSISTRIGGAVAYPPVVAFIYDGVYYDSDKLVGVNITESYDTPLTTSQIKDPVNFPLYNTSVWTLQAGKYPYLTMLGEPEAPPVLARSETVTSTSFMQSVVGDSEQIRRKIQTTLTSIQPISQSIHKELTTTCMSYIESIVSSATVVKNASMKTYTVTSSLSEITGHSTRFAKASRSTNSFIDPINSYVTVIVPVEVEKPIYATVYYVVNPSMVSANYSETDMKYQSNQSDVDHFTNLTEVDHIENASETSVI